VSVRIKPPRGIHPVASVAIAAAITTASALVAANGGGGSALAAAVSTSPSAGAGPSTPLAAPAGLPSTQQQISTLSAALAYMRTNYQALYKNFAGNEITDIFDYGVGSLWLNGTDGAGTTIAVLEAWDDPQINSDVAAFDKQLHLPNPQIQTIFPAGPLPSKCPPQMTADNDTCSSWGGEEAIDVDAIHLMAPYAKILVAVTPPDTQETDDAASNGAPPEMMKALETISSRHLANVISISGGTGESTYSGGAAQIRAQDPGELAAAAAGIPVLVATGDSGVVQQLATAGPDDGTDTTTTPDIATWSDSPWVTAVGGSVPHMSSQSPTKLGPDPLWANEGAGYSSVYARPTYQDTAGSAPMRSVPDITMDAQTGTSEAAPLLAGILALATQVNQGDLGPIDPALYGVLGPAGARDGISDVVSGDNSATVIPPGEHQSFVVPGFAAATGLDVASGWGTIYAPTFVPALAAASRASHQEAATRSQAQAQLNDLQQHSIQLTRTNSDKVYLRAGGLLPGHPVQLGIDGKTIATLTVDPLGDVTYMIDPTQLKLGSGRHNVTLTSMLLTETSQL
jgi:subtilase family serine protease